MTVDSEVRQKFEARTNEDLLQLALELYARAASYNCAESVHVAAFAAREEILKRMAGFEAGMRAGEIARWIPVEEKSPEITRTWTDCGNVYRQSDELLIFDSVVGRRTGCFYGPGWSGSEGDKLTSVTHWQPLPAAPEEKKPATPAELP